MNLKASFVSFLQQKYPQMQEEQTNTLISEQLLSPFQITLTSEQVSQLQKEIDGYWKLREWSVENLESQYLSLGLSKPNNYSACMSYDFHINSEGLPELIEINTNASFLALGLEMYEFLNLPVVSSDFNEKSLIEMFRNEIALSGGNPLTGNIAIIDENPSAQRLYIEFLLYQQIFKKNNVHCDIFDFRETNQFKNHALIYNRHTDFYLNTPASNELRDLFNAKLNFSPNSYEYFLLADKQRLLDWYHQTQIEKPASLLPIYDLATADREQIWRDKKHLFIKPKTSFGSKQAYKAASISQKVFEDVFNERFVAQKLSVPSEIEVVYEEKPLKFRYDLRCFVYKNKLQLIIARLYQGQTTNLKTLGGGFAAIKIKN